MARSYRDTYTYWYTKHLVSHRHTHAHTHKHTHTHTHTNTHKHTQAHTHTHTHTQAHTHTHTHTQKHSLSRAHRYLCLCMSACVYFLLLNTYQYCACMLWHANQHMTVDAGRSSILVASPVHVRWWLVSLSCSRICCCIMSDDAMARCHHAKDALAIREREIEIERKDGNQNKPRTRKYVRTSLCLSLLFSLSLSCISHRHNGLEPHKRSCSGEEHTTTCTLSACHLYPVCVRRVLHTHIHTSAFCAHSQREWSIADS